MAELKTSLPVAQGLFSKTSLLIPVFSSVHKTCPLSCVSYLCLEEVSSGKAGLGGASALDD